MTVERLLAAFPIGMRVVVDSLYDEEGIEESDDDISEGDEEKIKKLEQLIAEDQKR